MAFNPELQTFLENKIPIVNKKTYAYLLTEEEQAIMERISGAATAESLLDSLETPPETFWKSLFLFYCLYLIGFESEKAQGRSEPEAAKEKEVEPEQPRDKGIGGKPDRQASDEDINQRLDEVLSLKAALATRNYYQLLNISRTASPEDIKRSYFSLARRYHPDSFGRAVSKDYLDQIGEVFNAVTNAYRTLINTEKRKNYDGSLISGQAEESGDMVKRADIKFRQGKTLYAQERYEDAIIYLEEAVRMRKNKGDYYLLLAMAESKIPSFSRKAEEDFLKAVNLEPWNPEGHIGLGYLYKKAGLTAKAAKHFQKALEVDADHKLAKQELRLLKEGQKKKGLAGILSADIFKKKQ
jgi:curved DNA-binding protein CbpA